MPAPHDDSMRDPRRYQGQEGVPASDDLEERYAPRISKLKDQLAEAKAEKSLVEQNPHDHHQLTTEYHRDKNAAEVAHWLEKNPDGTWKHQHPDLPSGFAQALQADILATHLDAGQAYIDATAKDRILPPENYSHIPQERLAEHVAGDNLLVDKLSEVFQVPPEVWVPEEFRDAALNQSPYGNPLELQNKLDAGEAILAWDSLAGVQDENEAYVPPTKTVGDFVEQMRQVGQRALNQINQTLNPVAVPPERRHLHSFWGRTPVSSMRVKGIWTLQVGMSPSMLLDDQAEQWFYLVADLEQDLMQAPGDLTRFSELDHNAHLRARELTDPSSLNYVKLEFLWL